MGTASVVAMVSGGRLATRQALAQFKSLGTDLLSVDINQGDSGSSGGQRVTLKSVQGVVNAVPGVLLAAPYTNMYLQTSFKGHQVQGSILGVTQSLADVMKLQIDQGRFVSTLDNYSPYCVIGHKLYQNLKQYTVKPVLGSYINLGGHIFRIVGVIKPWQQNQFMYADLNGAVMVPINTSRLLSKYAQINTVIFKLKKRVNLTKTQDAIKDYFNQRYSKLQYYFNSPKALVEKMKAQQQIMTIFLGFIGSISLLVGGIGVMNIMLVSVTERHREIGIRLALGAKRRDIQFMFLIESIVLSLFGGLLGVLLGIFVSFLIAWFKNWSFAIFPVPIMIGFGVSALIGIFFGFYPARQASKLDPIETLRSE